MSIVFTEISSYSCDLVCMNSDVEHEYVLITNKIDMRTHLLSVQLNNILFFEYVEL